MPKKGKERKGEQDMMGLTDQLEGRHPPASPLSLPQREFFIKEVDESAPTSEQAYLKKQRKKWPGYKVPNWTDNKTPEQWRREGWIVAGE